MSDMKCPFCQQKIENFFVENRSVFACCNLNCKGYFMNAPKELWQELIRTRKALELAKKWLMKIGYLNMSDHGLGSEKMMTDWCKTVALHGLKEIETALEQKE